MSNTTNDLLLDKVGELMDYWVGTLWDRLMQRDLDHNDYEALKYHADQAYREMMLQEEGTYDADQD